MPTKKIVLVVVVAFFVLGGGYMLYMQTRQPDTEVVQSVLATGDERLTKGNKNAPLKIVEFTDMFCPYCARLEQDTIPKIESTYIDTGKAYFEMRLVAKRHPDSKRAANGAYCAAEQGKFWDYVDVAYNRSWTQFYALDKDVEAVDLFRADTIGQIASAAGLDTPSWTICVESGKYDSVIEKNEKDMDTLKAYGTPHFVMNGTNYNGAPNYDVFKITIENELQKAQEKK